MRRSISVQLRSASLALVVASSAACGDDGGSGGQETGPAASTSDGSTSTGEGSTSSSGEGSTTAVVDGSTSTAGGATIGDDTTTGSAGDPAYPPIVGGGCPEGALPVALPGAELCAPFCAGPGDPCPTAQSGDASPECTPFAGQAGSGQACDAGTPCPDGETCNEGTCADVAFYACQLLCTMGEACPDAMVCSGIGTCGYP